MLTALARDAAHAAAATKLMGSVGITDGSTGAGAGLSTLDARGPWVAGGGGGPGVGPGGGGSDCAFDVRSGLRRLDLARNDADESVAEAFAAMRAPGGQGTPCDVAI